MNLVTSLVIALAPGIFLAWLLSRVSGKEDRVDRTDFQGDQEVLVDPTFLASLPVREAQPVQEALAALAHRAHRDYRLYLVRQKHREGLAALLIHSGRACLLDHGRRYAHGDPLFPSTQPDLEALGRAVLASRLEYVESASSDARLL